MHHPTGEILFGGKDLLKAPDSDMRDIRGEKISIIFQEPMTSLNPLHTIQKQVGEIMKLHHGLDDATARERVLELLRKVGLDDPEKRLNAYPHQLSGGQRQRVMIAMALANEPDLLIADEPTTALDVTIQAQILELLKSLQRESGMAMLLITHDLGVVRHMADRVYVMNAGRDRRGGQDGRCVRAAAACLHAPSDVGRAQGPPARPSSPRASHHNPSSSHRTAARVGPVSDWPLKWRRWAGGRSRSASSPIVQAIPMPRLTSPSTTHPISISSCSPQPPPSGQAPASNQVLGPAAHPPARAPIG